MTPYLKQSLDCSHFYFRVDDLGAEWISDPIRDHHYLQTH